MVATDPWTSIAYTSDASGVTVGSASVDTGALSSTLVGKVRHGCPPGCGVGLRGELLSVAASCLACARQAMIVHAYDGSRIGCALLSDGVDAAMMASDFVPYFSYSGSLAVGGSVGPMTTTGTTQVFSYSLSGVDPACSSGAGTAANSCGSRQPRVDPCDSGLRGCRGCRCRRRRCRC